MEKCDEVPVSKSQIGLHDNHKYTDEGIDCLFDLLLFKFFFRILSGIFKTKLMRLNMTILEF